MKIFKSRIWRQEQFQDQIHDTFISLGIVFWDLINYDLHVKFLYQTLLSKDIFASLSEFFLLGISRYIYYTHTHTQITKLEAKRGGKILHCFVGKMENGEDT